MLTLLGGGVFGNDLAWIVDAIRWACEWACERKERQTVGDVAWIVEAIRWACEWACERERRERGRCCLDRRGHTVGVCRERQRQRDKGRGGGSTDSRKYTSNRANCLLTRGLPPSSLPPSLPPSLLSALSASLSPTLSLWLSLSLPLRRACRLMRDYPLVVLVNLMSDSVPPKPTRTHAHDRYAPIP